MTVPGRLGNRLKMLGRGSIRRNILEKAVRGIVGVQERFDFSAQFGVGAAQAWSRYAARRSGGSLTATLNMPLSDMGPSVIRIVALDSHAPTEPKPPVTLVNRAPLFRLAPEPVPAQPCLGEGPVLFGRRLGDAQHLGRFGHRAPKGVPQLLNSALRRAFS